LTHLLQLAALPLDQRKKWQQRVLVEDLTTNELRAALRQKSIGKKAPGSGRPVLPPKSAVGGLLQIQLYREAVSNRLEVWDKHVFKRILMSASEECTQELREHLDRTLQAEKTSIANAEHIIAKAQEAIERVDRAIENRKKRSREPVSRRDAIYQ